MKVTQTTVKAKIAGIEAKQEVKFINTPPEALILTLSKLTLKAGFDNEIEVGFKATRLKGKPSIGNVIVIVVKDGSHNVVGAHKTGTEAMTDENGSGKFTLAVYYNVKGLLSVTVYLKGKSSVSDTKNLQI